MPILEICDRCGAMIKDGAIRYKVRIMAAADDGQIVNESISDEEIEAIIAGFENADPDDITRKVFEERIFILCPECKHEFIQKPFGLNQDDSHDNGQRVFH